MSAGVRGEESNIQSTTAFAEDAATKDVLFLPSADIPSALVSAYKSEGVEDVISVLRKPCLIYNGVFAASDTGRITNFPPLGQLIGITKNARRLSGSQYIRADVVVELKVNAVRFQAGRYILGYLPYGGASPAVGGNNACDAWTHAHMANLVTITQLPHVEIDLATETSVKLRIPYQSVWNFYSTLDNDFDEIGLVFVVPYVALIPGSSDSTCQISVYSYMENITISGNVISQSGRISKEVIAASHGVISGVAEKVSRTASIFGSIPLLAPVCSTVSWVAGLVASAAKVWGFSKPHSAELASLHTRKAITNMANADGSFTGHSLGMSTTNEVAVHSGVSRTNVDEMSIDFIKKVPAYCSTTAWPTTSTTGTLLLTLYQSPNANNVAYGHGITVQPVSFLSQLFNQWKGSFVYRFKFVKTEFHSGRLVIAHLPVDATVVSPPSLTLAQTDNLYREIVDIRDTNEFDFKVPYVNNCPWAETVDVPGFIYVFVLNELVAPSVVSNSVPMIVEFLGGDDLEFSVPITSLTNYDVYFPYSSQSGTIAKIPPPVGDVTLNVDVEKYTTGEVCKSLRQFLKRLSVLVNDGTLISNRRIQHDCWTGAFQPTSLSTNVVREQYVQTDFFSLFSGIYAISSGSVRLYTHAQGAAGQHYIYLDPQVNNGQYISNTGYSNGVVNTKPHVFVDANIEGFGSVEIPQYTKTYGRNSISHLVSTTANLTPVGTSTSGGAATATVISLSGSTQTVNVWRSGGDDANFCVWAGIPALINSGNN